MVRNFCVLPVGERFQEAILREQSKEQESSIEPSRKVGVTKWLALAFELEYPM